MITVCHPVDDMELMFIRMELEAEAIPHFVVGQYFGSLYPGIQLPWYNERSVRVPADRAHEAEAVIDRVRKYYEPTFVDIDRKSKLRNLCEALIFGWVMPAGSKRRTVQSDAPGRRADEGDV